MGCSVRDTCLWRGRHRKVGRESRRHGRASSARSGCTPSVEADRRSACRTVSSAAASATAALPRRHFPRFYGMWAAFAIQVDGAIDGDPGMEAGCGVRTVGGLDMTPDGPCQVATRRLSSASSTRRPRRNQQQAGVNQTGLESLALGGPKARPPGRGGGAAAVRGEGRLDDVRRNPDKFRTRGLRSIGSGVDCPLSVPRRCWSVLTLAQPRHFGPEFQSRFTSTTCILSNPGSRIAHL